ncbi:sphingomyelin phosphodiesterase [Streptomyces sp. NPDC048508]|uniref:sphingomyelin phosphodiesterase n=1 Tax=Streptomyces sp. NPDC048508 TaxID=3365561 RepID=UPI003722A44A
MKNRIAAKAGISLLVTGILLGTSAFITPETVNQKSPENAAINSATIKIATSNAMLLPSFIWDEWAQDTRGELIGSAPYTKNQDIVAFQELMDNTASEKLLNKLKVEYPYATPVVGRSKSGWDDTQGDYSVLTPEDGGVAMVSRWPITRKVQYIYSESCGTDSLAQKGFAYARVDVSGSPTHVIATHLQADDSACSTGEAAKVRLAQLKEIKAFVDKLKVPLNEPIIFAGDMNINRYGSEYPKMISALNAAEPQYDGFPFTMDPITNSIAKERYADEPRQWLDYIVFDKSHAHPSSWHNTGEAVSSPGWSLDGKTYYRYSDHYPVQGS